ncbi:MAG: helix-turn-helix transcriptional regulator [Brachyspira sp.]|jgi:subunit S of type I restriction-modification system|nr:helix-turn-helix transcriptional regulator [Brachyspira sp.]
MLAKGKKYTKKVGRNVKLARIKAGLNQEELAEKADLSRETIGAVERGEKSPTIETIGSIADALGIEIHKLFIFD